MLSLPVVKKNYILATDEVSPNETQQNEGLKCVFFPKPKIQYHVYQWKLPISHFLLRKETRSLPRTKFVPLIPNKTKHESLFSETKASISCIKMGTTNFSLPVSKRNQTFSTNVVHPVDSQENEGLECFFFETKASITCILMGTTHLSLLVAKKKTRSLQRTKFVPLIPNKTNG